jgi:hypothetical protein
MGTSGGDGIGSPGKTVITFVLFIFSSNTVKAVNTIRAKLRQLTESFQFDSNQNEKDIAQGKAALNLAHLWNRPVFSAI